MQQKGAENVEQAKNTILLVRGTAAEPAALSAFTAAQPDVQLQAISGWTRQAPHWNVCARR